MLRTLIPSPASGRARPLGRTGRIFGFGLTPRAMWLLVIGVLLALPAFWHPRAAWFMGAWDALLLAVVCMDAWRLPRPRQLRVSRTFLDSPQLGVATRVELAVTVDADQVLQMRVTDDLHPALVGVPETRSLEVFPREPAVLALTIWPRERGEFALRRVYLRYRGALGLAERWAAAELGVGSTAGEETTGSFAALRDGKSTKQWEAAPEERRDVRQEQPQRVRVFPAHEQARRSNEFFLMRARQMERQRRQLKLRGAGREFESLREYQPGDELRSVSWTATARRGRIVTRQFMAERSQQVWVVLDAGRLSRTAFALRRTDGPRFTGETEAERDEAHRLTVTQLDQATTATVMLAQVVGQTGDKIGMLAYGTGIQQVLPPGAGPAHLRLLIDLLSATRSEAAEGDALLAVARLKRLQRRRGLMVWITELPDTAGRPELVTAAAALAKLHLVVLVLLKHPELGALATALPANREEMFHAAAATEMEERRRETIAQLERQGVLIVEASAEEIGVRAVSEYLEVKSRGLL
ncbi:MAG: DUF58 domain-containing protein [Janthinobacterium lividum]